MMVHLFNKIYLRHESVYDSNADSVMLRSERKSHPLASLVGFIGGELPTFDEVIRTEYENNIEKFWFELWQKDSSVKFDVFVDTSTMYRLLIQFWKSIFKNSTSQSLYRLLNFYILDLKLKSYLVIDGRVASKKELQEALVYLSQEEFLEIFEKTAVVEFLQKMDKSRVSFEFLLANYFVPEVKKYREDFEVRLSTLAWVSWFDDIQILRSEILSGFYDLNKVLPSLQMDIESPMKVEEVILQTPSLAWMLDPKFLPGNMDYILRKYNKEFFNELYSAMVYLKGGDAKKEIVTDSQVFVNYQVQLTNLIFEEKLAEYLERDISDGFGCRLISDHLQLKANQLFPSFVYDKVRNKQTADLKEYELS